MGTLFFFREWVCGLAIKKCQPSAGDCSPGVVIFQKEVEASGRGGWVQACGAFVGEEKGEVGSALEKVTLLNFLVSFQEQQPSWTDDLPLCHLSGVGSASNRSYSADGKGTESHPPEDNWLKFR